MPELGDRTKIVDQEVPGFLAEDMFMSRTDERGVILSGNAVFHRLAGYDWDELLGAPHKIIRHPDMPRGVFHLFWERLKEGKPIGAYVKNRAKDGRYYWVFATALPIDGGYVSVRIKPSSDLFEAVKLSYQSLLKREAEEGLSPEESAGALRELICDAGYKTYREFMAVAIRQETSARRKALERRPDRFLSALDDLKDAVDDIGVEIEKARGMFESIRGTPTNLRIQASRFGDTGVPIQIISQNYDLLTREIECANESMAAVFDELLEQLDEDSFALTAVALLAEATRRFQREADLPPGLCMERESEILRPHTELFARRADEMLARTEGLLASSRQLQRIVSGLAVTRVMCRIEAAALTGDAGGIAEIINRLLQFQSGVMSSIEKIEAGCRTANRTMERLVAELQKPRDETIPQGAMERRKKARIEDAA